MEEMIIKNVAAMDHDYVYTEQQTSYNSGLDWEVTASWKHLRTEASVKMSNEWVSAKPQRIPLPESAA